MNLLGKGSNTCCILLLVRATEKGQVVLVDVLGDMETVGLDQLLVLCQLVLVNREELVISKQEIFILL